MAADAIDVGLERLAGDAFDAVAAGVSGRSCLSNDTRHWMHLLEPQLPPQFWVHDDASARRAVRRLGLSAFAHRQHIYIGDVPFDSRQAVLRHELVHLAQMEVALRTGQVASGAEVEREAAAIGRQATPVRHGADTGAIHPLFPLLLAIGAGLYVLLYPKPANAPGPGDTPLPAPSDGKILGEAICLFAVPGGSMALGTRLGIGFLGRSALAGAATSVSLQAVGDVDRGRAASPLLYLYDAATRTAIGFVVPGGFRLIGQVGTRTFDQLATLGLNQSDIALTGYWPNGLRRRLSRRWKHSSCWRRAAWRARFRSDGSTGETSSSCIGGRKWRRPRS